MSSSESMRGSCLWIASLRRLLVGASFGLACVGVPHRAPAQSAAVAPGPETAAPRSLERARSLFAEAVDLEAGQQWLEASEKLREVLAIRETSGVRFHLAYCLENHGALVAALDNYRRAAQLNAADPAEDVAVLLEPALERVALRVPRLTLEVDAPAAELVIDGVAYPLHEPLLLDPGPHVIEVMAPGFIPGRRKVTLIEAERRTLVVELDPLPPRRAAIPEPVAATADRSLPRTALLATGAFALVTAGAGAALTVARTRASRQVDDGRVALAERGATAADCADPRTVEVERACWQMDVYGTDRDRARRWQTVTFAATALGVAGFTSGYLGWRVARKSREQGQPLVRRPRFWVTAHPGRSAQLVLSARF
jgi:hypothetical protein